MFPVAPEGGGYLVLTPAQMANKELIALIREVYPQTKIIEQQPIPTDGTSPWR